MPAILVATDLPTFHWRTASSPEEGAWRLRSSQERSTGARKRQAFCPSLPSPTTCHCCSSKAPKSNPCDSMCDLAQYLALGAEPCCPLGRRSLKQQTQCRSWAHSVPSFGPPVQPLACLTKASSLAKFARHPGLGQRCLPALLQGTRAPFDLASPPPRPLRFRRHGSQQWVAPKTCATLMRSRGKRKRRVSGLSFPAFQVAP